MPARFPAVAEQLPTGVLGHKPAVWTRLQYRGAHTILTGLLDRSALYGVLAEIDALGLDLLELRLLSSGCE
jgi:hypothetical protein